MKKLLVLFAIAMSLYSQADVVVSDLSTISISAPKVVTSVVTNKMAVKDVKIVWTSFTISYAPPAYTQATYVVSFILKDNKTGREIPNSRGIQKMSEKEVFMFAATKGVDFTQMGQGIGYLLNEYLKTLFAQPKTPESPSN